MIRIAIPLLLLVCAAPAEEDPPLAVARLEWESGRIGGAEASKIPLAPGADGRLEGKLELGERALKLLLDSKQSQLWLDLDLDGDLADEKAIRIRPFGIAWTVNKKLGGRGGAELSFYRTATCKPDHVHVYPRSHRRGTVVLGGRVRALALADGNADLRFDSLEHDLLFLDLDGDGTLGGDDEKLALGKTFFLGDRGFVAKVAQPDGSVVEFRKASGTPPRTKQPWKKTALPAYGYLAEPPAESLKDLEQRFAENRKKGFVSRLPTLQAIASLKSKEAFAFLKRVAQSKDEPFDMRMWAVKAMGHPAYARFAGDLVEIAGNETEIERCAQALLALHFMDHPGRERIYLDKLERSQKTRVVWAAAVGLVLLHKTAPVERAVREHSSPTLRAQAYQALRYADAGPGTDVMRAAARDSSGYVRSFALEDMFRMQVPGARAQALLSAGMRPLQPSLSRVLVAWLGRDSHAESVEALLAMAPGAKADLLGQIRRALAPIREPSVTAELVGALHAPAPEVRILAAQLLAALPERKTTDALAKQVKREKDPNVVAAIFEALGEHKDPRVVPILLAAARKKDPVRRAAAIRGLAAIGPGFPRVRAFFLKLLNASRWEDRVYALDAAAAAEDPAVLSKVTPNLSYRVWQVRLAAAQALGELRQKSGIEPLIRRLEKEDVKRVRAAIAEALFRITGLNFYDFADLWARWWKEKGAGFAVPDEIPERPPPRQGGTVAAFYGLPLDSGRVIFVIDKSGSMTAEDAEGRSRLETAVSEVIGAVGRLKAKDKVNVIFFESTIHSWKPKLLALKPANRGDLRKYLEAQRPAGGTNLYDGLELALADKEVDTIFLLSDGMPGAGKFVMPADILREVARVNQARRIAIHCVSVGTDSHLLKKLAAAHGGRYVRR